MVNIRERLEALEAALKAAKAALWAEEQAALKVAEDAWLQAGGCDACRGSGLAAEATIDYDAVVCRECGGSGGTAEPRQKPFLGANHLHDRNVWPVTFPPSTHDLQMAVWAIQKPLEVVKRHAQPEKGKTLRVYKGRKVAKGTTGECIWVGASNWGVRVGIKDATGTVHWTAADNCEVLFSDNDLGLKNLEVQP